ncbi:MAG: NAD(P)-dependent oxidoreductase [Chloroflexota bacterium]|nr:NAD(P)-dependent oxidoreductase [Chloroflexota bacterium]
MRILVTGGAGRIGRATLERLVTNGYTLRAIDTKPDFDMDGVEYVVCDINDYAATRAVMDGVDAIIHLAAIPAPTIAPGHEVFRINAAGTFNVFEAAEAAGIKRVVQASSINAVGCTYSLVDLHIKYFPLDEAHPTNTTDAYSLSKGVIEDIGAYYWRRARISGVAMRFPWVYPSGTLSDETFLRRRSTSLKLLDELSALTPTERRKRIAEARAWVLEYRRTRPLEYTTHNGAFDESIEAEHPLRWVYLYERFNFWAFVDERDAAQSLEKAATAEYDGAHPLFVMDAHNWLGAKTKLLSQWFFPGVRWKTPPIDSSGMVSIDKARALIGFEPEYSVSKASF